MTQYHHHNGHYVRAACCGSRQYCRWVDMRTTANPLLPTPLASDLSTMLASAALTLQTLLSLNRARKSTIDKLAKYVTELLSRGDLNYDTLRTYVTRIEQANPASIRIWMLLCLGVTKVEDATTPSRCTYPIFAFPTFEWCSFMRTLITADDRVLVWNDPCQLIRTCMVAMKITDTDRIRQTSTIDPAFKATVLVVPFPIHPIGSVSDDCKTTTLASILTYAIRVSELDVIVIMCDRIGNRSSSHMSMSYALSCIGFTHTSLGIRQLSHLDYFVADKIRGDALASRSFTHVFTKKRNLPPTDTSYLCEQLYPAGLHVMAQDVMSLGKEYATEWLKSYNVKSTKRATAVLRNLVRDGTMPSHEQLLILSHAIDGRQFEYKEVSAADPTSSTYTINMSFESDILTQFKILGIHQPDDIKAISIQRFNRHMHAVAQRFDGKPRRPTADELHAFVVVRWVKHYGARPDPPFHAMDIEFTPTCIIPCSRPGCENEMVDKFKRCEQCKSAFCSVTCLQLDWDKTRLDAGHFAFCTDPAAYAFTRLLDMAKSMNLSMYCNSDQREVKK